MPGADPLKPGTVPPQIPVVGDTKSSRARNISGASEDTGVDQFIPSSGTDRAQVRESVVRSFGLSDDATALLLKAVNKKNPLA